MRTKGCLSQMYSGGEVFFEGSCIPRICILLYDCQRERGTWSPKGGDAVGTVETAQAVQAAGEEPETEHRDAVSLFYEEVETFCNARVCERDEEGKPPDAGDISYLYEVREAVRGHRDRTPRVGEYTG